MKPMAPPMCRLCETPHWAREGCKFTVTRASQSDTTPKVAKTGKAAAASAKPSRRKNRKAVSK